MLSPFPSLLALNVGEVFLVVGCSGPISVNPSKKVPSSVEPANGTLRLPLGSLSGSCGMSTLLSQG